MKASNLNRAAGTVQQHMHMDIHGAISQCILIKCRGISSLKAQRAGGGAWVSFTVSTLSSSPLEKNSEVCLESRWENPLSAPPTPYS
jgi:hypothetical protein